MFSHTLLRNEHHVERSSSDVRGTRKGVSERQPTPLKQLADVGEDKSISWPLPTKMEFRPPDVRVTAEDDRSARQCPLCVLHKRAELTIHSNMRSIK